ncbi:glucocorticoid modulatory element-binding protein 1 [Astyanax mexicanus]|uniref:Glucocorticoid modulatory element-binding protein 1 n=1 Tax=Astyanax mexicanus TaxID=7994 RepID=A0A8T2M455_ASTMX|nr:glucocorticoid modulatory element-binding protein 1 [Astyanax mexicanus]
MKALLKDVQQFCETRATGVCGSRARRRFSCQRSSCLRAGSGARRHDACALRPTSRRCARLGGKEKRKRRRKVLSDHSNQSVVITMSVGDVVKIKEEEDVHCDGHKTQLILHLQSVSQGTEKERSTTVLAVETQQDDNSEGDEVEYGYPITCGDSKAVLLFKKFVCPGINVRCVKFNDQLISPKQFVHLAGKATLKDWKRAIRLGGVMLRKMMDSGQIDFYQHETVCTNSCRSTKFDLLINSTRLTQGVQQTPSSPVMGQVSIGEEMPDETDSDVGDSWPPQEMPAANNENVRMHTEEVSDESLNLWKGIAEMGLMGAVVSTIRSELLAMLSEVERRSEQATLQESDAAALNTLTRMFGLLDSVRQVLDLQRKKTDENQQHIHDTLNVLSDQLNKQKTMLGVSKPTPIERPRLQRPSSTSVLSSSPSPFTVLSPITLASSSQPLTMAGLPVAMLAQLPSGIQLLPHHTNSTASRAGAMTVASPNGLTVLGNGFGDGTSAIEVLHLKGEGDEEDRVSVLRQDTGDWSGRQTKNTEQESRETGDVERVVGSGKLSRKRRRKSETYFFYTE